LPWILSACAALLALSLWLLSLSGGGPASQQTVSLRTEVAIPSGAPAAARRPPAAAGTPIRIPIYPLWTEEHAKALFGIGPLDLFDPLCGKIYKPGARFKLRFFEHPDQQIEFVVNSRSMREDNEPRELQPELRVLVTGDSHTDGVCQNSESFANITEGALRRRAIIESHKVGESFEPDAIEVLNADKGGYSFFNYLAVLERYLDLKPDVFVVAVFGGNDFEEALSVWHYYKTGGDRPPGSEAYPELVDAAIKVYRGALPQGPMSVKYFDKYPEQKAIALQAAGEVFAHMRALCAERGIRLIVLYLPPRQDVEQGNVDLRLNELLNALDLQRNALSNTDEMADALLARLSAENIETIDLRGPFRAATETLYWRADWHLNLAGHRTVARELMAWLKKSH
jgi:hypothetical protein